MIHLPLPSVPFLHLLLNAVQNLVIPQFHPRLADEETRRHLTGKTLDDDVGVEAFGEVDDEVDIFF